MINLTNESSGFNLFENLPDEVIQKNIGCYFNLNETLTATLVDKRFRVIFEDNTIWKRFYIELGLEAPSINAKKMFPLWKSIYKTIDKAAKGGIDNVYQKERCRSLCISALVVPELSSVHSFALGKLREQCGLPETFSDDELILEVARGHQDYKVSDSARLLAIKSISNRAADPAVKDLLRSLITVEGNTRSDADSRCAAGIQGLIPFANEPEIKEALITCLRNHRPHAVSAALDKIISEPGVVTIVIKAFEGGSGGLSKFLKDHLNDPNIVNELLIVVNETHNYHLLGEVISALEPVVDQIPVQQALCRRFAKIPPGKNESYHAEMAFNWAICKAKLSDELKKEFRELTAVQKVTDADKILQLNVLTQRKELLAALSDKKEWVRAAAAKVLAPLVTDDLEIRNAFIKRVRERDIGKVGRIVIPALASVMHRRFYRKTLIERGCLDGNPLKTIKVLRPYIAEPEVREAFLKTLKSYESTSVRHKLIDCLAPEIEKADVLPLFLDAANDKLSRQHYHSGTGWQVAAIDKLGAIADKPEVKTVLLEQFNKGYYAVKAACIRALCSDGKMGLGPDQLFSELTNISFDVREEARKTLVSWINRMSAESTESGV